MWLHPTYSCAHLYRHGDRLARHCDPAACEVSIGLNLFQEPDEPWPLHLQFGHYDVCVKLKAGDALLHPALAMPFAARLSANS